jgi:hypothetical protein
MPASARKLLVTIATALISLLAVTMAAVYLATPTRTALAVEVSVDSSVSVPLNKVVIYGRARDYRGRPVARVRIAVSKARRVTLVALSRADGTFRKSSSLASGAYILVASRKSKGKTRSARASIKIRHGRAYRVTVRLVRSGGLTIVPVRAY